MKKSIVFLVIMVMLCSTAYAIYQEPASTGVLTSRSIVIKTTPITGDIIDPLFRPTSKTEQKGLIIWNGKIGSKSIGGGGDPWISAGKATNSNRVSLGGGGDPHAPAGKAIDSSRTFLGSGGDPRGQTSTASYPGRDGKQQQAKTSIIDPIFQKGIVDPTFKTGTKSIIDPSFIVDPTFRPTSGQSTKGIVDPTFKTGAGRKYTRSPTTGRWVEDITTEAVINVPKLTQTSMSSNPYYLGGAEKAMTAGQAYSMGQKSITQKPNPYTFGGAGVPTTAGQAKDIDAILKERKARAEQILAKGY